ncbi:MAG: histidinol dehydrogenase [Nitrosomonadales bacterium]|nr:histidinol dehydrogenase [Nitrosomonadales bacterium]
MDIKRQYSTDKNFFCDLKKNLVHDSDGNTQIEQTTRAIVNEIKKRGDRALIEFTANLDQFTVSSVAEMEISKARLTEAFENIPKKTKENLKLAAERIRDYHLRQKSESWNYEDGDGSSFGQKITPIDSVGLYVPGGKAAYPSSVLMNAIPAKIAGVKNLIMVVPTPGGEQNDLVLAAAKIAGVDRVFTIGGAQAIAALAFGTETIPSVDKIVGPGNAYVAEAKRLVFGIVGIDMIAGPSEITIICDGKTNPDWIAMDLFSQAEHDELSQSILIATDEKFIESVNESIDRLIKEMPRKTIIKSSLEKRGLFILAKDLSEAAKISNFIAPEHLELSVENPNVILNEICHAGAIFMGKNTCEAVGDYCAGPNHVLPTSGTARFSSPLGVYDFQKRSSLIYLSEKAAGSLGGVASNLAMGEGLYAHAESAKYRINKKK